MRDEEPETKDGLGEDVKYSVGDDFTINRHMTTTISDAPDAADVC